MKRFANLAEEFAKLGPWIYQFQIDGQIYGGGISAVGDVRVERFLRFAPNAKTIMELGSLEGGQTLLLIELHSTRERPLVYLFTKVPAEAAKK